MKISREINLLEKQIQQLDQTINGILPGSVTKIILEKMSLLMKLHKKSLLRAQKLKTLLA